jgi:penicillin-binding protein 1A
MLHMLKGGIEEAGGTSRGLSSLVREGNEIGGKTGTTNNASDGWYIGVTRDLVTGTWVGGDERSIHFRNWYMGQGSKTARPIWDIYMQKIYADSILGYEKAPLKKPINGIKVELDCNKFGNPNSNFGIASDSTLIEFPREELEPEDIL